ISANLVAQPKASLIRFLSFFPLLFLSLLSPYLLALASFSSPLHPLVVERVFALSDESRFCAGATAILVDTCF
ncbi:hypothetical protein ASPWEDRAFT_145362, partial [Aspergillus wentii DTO 134E9]